MGDKRDIKEKKKRGVKYGLEKNTSEYWALIDAPEAVLRE